jgi:uncharacterized protein (TIGR03067 family)
MTTSCPDRASWQQLVDGSLPEGQQAELTAHLDTCAACRSVVDGLSTVGDSMVRLAGHLRQPVSPADTALQNAINDIKSSTHTEETLAEPAGKRDEDLAFLAQPAQPGHLGRLAHYEIHEVIGRGGFGVVLKAFDEKLHRIVAVKVLAPSLAASGSARKRFIKEARAAAAMAHEHIVGIYAVDEEHNPPYLVMQCIIGMSLQQKLDKQGPLELKEILRIGTQIADGLAAAHKVGKIHRDIKPANILLENGVERVKITDFGLARAVDDASVTQSGVIAGTPMYMSPEQAEGVNVDLRSDLFSLGTVLYVMCTGRPPFRATGTMAVMKRVIEDTPTPIREVNPDIPEWLADIIAKLHAKKPDERIQSAKEVAELLGRHLADVQAGRSQVAAKPRGESSSPAGLAPATATPSPAGAPKRHWLRKAAAAVLASVVIAIAVAGITYLLRPHTYAITLEKDDPDIIVRIWPTAQSDAPINLAGSVEILGEPLHTLRDHRPSHEIRLPAGHYWLIAELNGREVHRVFMKLQGNEFVTHYHEKIGPVDNWVGKTDVGLPNVVFIPGAANLRQLEKARLSGDWRAIAAEQDGKPLPKDIVDKVNLRLRFGVNDVQLEMQETAQTKRTEKRGPYLLDALKKPATLDIEDVFDGKRLLAIYRWDGAKLILCGGAPGQHERPTEFATKTGDRRMLFVLVRDKAGSTGEPEDEPGWVQLFNKKDLLGWKKHPAEPGDWTVENGLLVGKSGRLGYLFSERGDYANFRLRAKVKLNAGGDSGIFVRSEFGPMVEGKAKYVDKKSPPGYEAQICNDASGHRTGSLFLVQEGAEPALTREERQLVKPDEWCILEVIADGPWLTVLVNGERAAGPVKNDTYARGHIALQMWHAKTTVYFEKIEIKELPLAEPGWVQLFNRQNTIGWKLHPKQTDSGFSVFGGILSGKSSSVSHIFSDRGDFENFHLRARLKLDDNAVAAIGFRSEFGLSKKGKFPAAYKVQLQNHGDVRTGSLMDVTHIREALVKPGEWFTLEIIAVGPHMIVKVNDKTTVDHRDLDHTYRKGHIALESIGPSAAVHFEKIEIKELPAAEPGWIKLFDGRSLSEWQAIRPETAFAWTIKDGILVGKSKPTYKGGIHFKTVREFGNEFHLKFEAKIGDGPGAPMLAYAPGQNQGFRVHLASSDSHPAGSVVLYKNNFSLIKPAVGVIKAGEWYRFEIICYRNRLRMRVNDKSFGDVGVQGGIEKRGTLGLFCAGDATIHIRSIEIKELSPDEFGWVSLFNGTDLTGWNRGKAASGEWKVQDSAIVGKGDQAWLVTDRKDFKDFHLRMKAKYVNGMAQLILRGNNERHDAGYFVYLNHGKGDFNTGAIYTAVNFKAYTAPVREERTKPGEWFDLEIIARGKHFQTFVNGAKALDWTDPAPQNVTAGELRLYILGKDAELHVKALEIKDLAPAEPVWVQLFNDKDLTNWKTTGGVGTWTVDKGHLIGKGDQASLRTNRADFADFHLRVEAKYVRGGGRILLREQDTVGKAYAVFMSSNPGGYRTGALSTYLASGGPTQLQDKELTKHDEWFTLEIIARGNQLQTLVNGVKTADVADASKNFAQGFLRLLVSGGKDAELHIKKIEIKELLPNEAGWVELFNRKDTTGWKHSPGPQGVWSVQGGFLTGAGARGHLYTSRDDFENFHCRLRAKINGSGNSGLFFRARYQEGFPGGYEAQINAASHLDPLRTGSLMPAFDSGLTAEDKKKLVVTEPLHRPDEWFDLDVIAVGNRITIKVNGKTTVDFIDKKKTFTRGHLALQQFGADTTVAFSKIEIMDLPPAEAGWLPLFNNKDLAGWDGDPKAWSWLDGKLVGDTTKLDGGIHEPYLFGLKQLRTLDLRRTKVSVTAASKLQKRIPGLAIER